MAHSAQTSDAPVTRRAVFYIPGYDPIHPRRYRELYRKEGAAQAQISGYELSLSARQVGARYGWDVKGLVDGVHVDASVDVLVWSDIVRGSMETSIPATYWQLLRTAWVYIGSGALWRLMQLRKGPVIAALYPVGMLLAQLFTALLLAWLIVRWGGALALPVLGIASYLVAGMLALAAFLALMRWFKAKDAKFFAYYLMHDYAFGAATKGANTPELEARMGEFGEAIAAALASDVEEVLVVGHSSGAYLGVSVLAEVIRAGGVPEGGPALAFLSLGQVVPMVSFLRDAQRLRADLAYLGASDALTWVDVTAPGDGCAFALCDPVEVSGVAPEGQRWRFFRLHFQYMCSFDRPRDDDYFQITAGPQTLEARYRDRPASKSRITRAVNKFTDHTP